MRKISIAALVWLALLGAAQAQVKTPVFTPATTNVIAAGGTWQPVFTQNNNRLTLWIENYCSTTSQQIATTESLYVWIQQGTTVPSGNPYVLGAFELGVCGSITFNGSNVTTAAIWVWGGTTNHTFAAWQNQ